MLTGDALRIRTAAADGPGTWLLSRNWDLTYIIFSCVLVSIPVGLHYLVGLSTDTINILVALIIGGPHMYSTYTYTFLERSFVRTYPLYTALSLLIPVAVVYLAVVNLTLLLTMFMFWASIHVLHQITFLVECYRTRGRQSTPLWSRLIDYGVIFTSLYPVAVYKLVYDEFGIEQRVLQIPYFLKSPLLVYGVWALFAIALGAFLVRTAWEVNRGTLLLPKFLLISVTVVLAFSVPFFGNLDVAFQGMNVWHSLQYLALVWYLNSLREQRGEITSRAIRGISGFGRVRQFYLATVAATVGGAALIGVLYYTSGLSFKQAYYIVVLSFLLVHYFMDQLLFVRPRVLVGS